MKNKEQRVSWSAHAYDDIEKFSLERVMEKWEEMLKKIKR